MQKTKKYNHIIASPITVNTETLAENLDCGKATAVKIGNAAGAKIQIGKRVLWNVDRINSYLDSISRKSKGDS